MWSSPRIKGEQLQDGLDPLQVQEEEEHLGGGWLNDEYYTFNGFYSGAWEDRNRIEQFGEVEDRDTSMAEKGDINEEMNGAREKSFFHSFLPNLENSCDNL